MLLCLMETKTILLLFYYLVMLLGTFTLVQQNTKTQRCTSLGTKPFWRAHFGDWHWWSREETVAAGGNNDASRSPKKIWPRPQPPRDCGGVNPFRRGLSVLSIKQEAPYMNKDFASYNLSKPLQRNNWIR